MRALLSRWLVPVLLGALVVVLALVPLWLNQFKLSLFNTLFIHVIVLAGFAMIVGFAKQLSLASVGFFGIGAYGSALAMIKLGLPFAASFLLVILAAAILATLLGLVAVRFHGLFLALVTLGYSEIVRLVADNWISVTGGWTGIGGIPNISFGPLVLRGEAGYYYFLLPLAAAALLVAFRLRHSPVGRVWLALSVNEAEAKAAGINTSAYKLLAFVLSVVLAAVAGAVFASYMKRITPVNFTMELSIFYIMVLVIGGRESLGGTVAAAAAFTFLSPVLAGLGEYRGIVYGVLIVAAVMFVPGGIGSLVHRLWRRLIGPVAGLRQR